MSTAIYMEMRQHARGATAAQPAVCLGDRYDTRRPSRGPDAVRVRSSQYKWQATLWPEETSLRAGVSTEQRGIARGQRVWKRQPGGGDSALGTSPEIVSRSCF